MSILNSISVNIFVANNVKFKLSGPDYLVLYFFSKNGARLKNFRKMMCCQGIKEFSR